MISYRDGRKMKVLAENDIIGSLPHVKPAVVLDFRLRDAIHGMLI